MNSCDETKDEEEEKEGEEDEEGRCVPDGEDYEAKTEACTAMTNQKDCEAWQGTSGRNEDNCKWKSGEQSGGGGGDGGCAPDMPKWECFQHRHQCCDSVCPPDVPKCPSVQQCESDYEKCVNDEPLPGATETCKGTMMRKVAGDASSECLVSCPPACFAATYD